MRVRNWNGYRLIYKPDHPNSMKGEGNWIGWIYEHVWIISESIGRPLKENEVVHHLDCNRSNNRLNNLIVLSRGHHAKLHQWIDAGCMIHESYNITESKFNKDRITEPKFCQTCGITLQVKQKYFCSTECRNKQSKCPSKEQLKEDIQNMTWVAIGKKYGVSDNGARKWAKKYKLI